MTTSQCQHCTAETSNGLALCQRCQQTLEQSCVNAGAYFADVERIQPGQRVKAKSAYRSTPPPGIDPAVDRISDTLDHAQVIVVGWARNLADDRGLVLPTATVTAFGWLGSHALTIATLEWAGDCVSEMLDVERSLKRILDKSDTGTFAGVCGNEIGRAEVDGETVAVECERSLYATASTTWVTCPECGRTWDSAERREVMREQAEDRVAPVRVLAGIVVNMTSEVSTERLIRKVENWASRPKDNPKLKSAGTRYLDGRLRTVYRIGDVLTLLKESQPATDEAC